MVKKIYTTALAKGQGMIPETLAILEIWEPEMSRARLVSQALEKGVLARATAHRVKDIVNTVFSKRYLADGSPPALNLKHLLSGAVPTRKLSQLFFVYTARANLILYDFVREVYWEKYSTGSTHLNKDDALHFIESATNRGSIPKPWSWPMRDRVARYLLGCLEDFGLLGPLHKGQREILPFGIAPLTTLYLAHEMHFAGMSDNAVLGNDDWRLAGLERRDVVRELERVSYGKHFIVQYSGELLRIAWKYKSMEECLDAIAASEL